MCDDDDDDGGVGAFIGVFVDEAVTWGGDCSVLSVRTIVLLLPLLFD